jgi:hypothetical protein
MVSGGSVSGRAGEVLRSFDRQVSDRSMPTWTVEDRAA